MKPELLLDCDGLLSDFLGSTLTHLEAAGMPLTEPVLDWEVRKYLSKEQLAFVYNLWKSKGFAAQLPVYPGAQAAVKELRKIATVSFCTSHWEDSDTWVAERTKWLAQNFGSGDIYYNHKKWRVWGDIFVDDHVKNLKPWGEKWGAAALPILWSQPYNTTMEWDGRRIGDWGQLIEVVADFKNIQLKQVKEQFDTAYAQLLK